MKRQDCTRTQGTRIAHVPIMTNSHDITSQPDLMSPRDATRDPETDGDEPRPSLLDQERVASMADEGGASGALMEIEDLGERKRLMQTQRRRRLEAWQKAAAAVALLGMVVFAVGWLRRTA